VADLPSSEDSTCFEMIDLRQGGGIPAPTAISPPTKSKQHYSKGIFNHCCGV